MFDYLLHTINWREPLWLVVTLQPLFLWLILSWYQNRKKQQFADSHLLPYLQVHTAKSPWKSVLENLFSRNSAYVLTWLFFALSLAGPRLPDKPKNQQNEIVLDVMMVVDLSRSMLATDIKPSRLRRATLEAFDLLSIAKNTRIGITVYAARPHLFVPITSDFKALRFYLKNLDSLQLPTLGSDASAALTFATKELVDAKTQHKQVMLWLTDGDIQSSKNDDIKNSLNFANQSNIDTYILGLGTIEGSGIPLADGSWLESEGQAVISKMDTKQLQQFSKIGNGLFVNIASDNSDWESLYQQGMLTSLSPPKHDDTQQWQQLFPWTLFPAIILLLIALFPFRFKIPKTKEPITLKGVSIISAVTIISLLSVPSPTQAKEANYLSSVTVGIEAYKNKEFALSKREFIQSVLTASDNKERAMALHNLGNALFQTGDYSSAAEVFTDALRYAPEQKVTIENQKLSLQIYLLIEKRKKRLKNQGNFSTPNEDSPLFDLPDQIPYMLSSKAVMLLKASLPDLPESAFERLLSKEMQQFQLMQDEQIQKQKQQQQETLQKMQQARTHLMGLEEAPSNDLWKRLFEIEEGFPAKLKEPKSIPGIRPW